MTEKNEKLKPPARRTGRTGRTLGGAKKAAPPPPPPAAELTPEQYAAEQATPQDEGHPAASEPQAQHAPSTIPTETSAQDRTEAAPEVTQISAQPTAEAPERLRAGAGRQSAGSPGRRRPRGGGWWGAGGAAGAACGPGLRTRSSCGAAGAAERTRCATRPVPHHVRSS
ncbi:hypothetical protein SALBM311S_11931 [Streptomyces alboniger]